MVMVDSNIAVFISIVLIYMFVIHPKFSLQEQPLPRNWFPRHYLLKMYTDLDNNLLEFRGSVKIIIICNEDTNQIYLNTKGLEINKDGVKLNLRVDKEEIYTIDDQNYLPEIDQYYIILEDDLESRVEYELFIPFKGQYSAGPSGFILINYFYEYEDGVVQRYHAVTQMGTFVARTVFPCFDQIDMKSTFKILIYHPKGFYSFSNMREKNSRDVLVRGDEWIMDEYEESRPISPCFVTLAIVPKEYGFINFPIDGSQMEFKVWEHETQLQRLQFTGFIMQQSFNFYQNYLSIPYPLPELNIIVFPHFVTADIGFYGSIALGKSSIIEQLPVDGIEEFSEVMDLCHLIGHQWIGSHATMSSWNEYWLHEALSHHLTELCANSMSIGIPKTTEVFIASEFVSILKKDQEGLVNEFPTSMDNFSKETLNTVYQKKGYILIRMLYFILGENRFRQSLLNYLQTFAFKNSSVSEVWNIFSRSGRRSLPRGLTIEIIMNSWTERKRFPLLTVTVNHEDDRVIIEQKMFTRVDESNPESVGSSQAAPLWIIPLSYYKQGESPSSSGMVDAWMINEENIVLEVEFENNEWILVNCDFNVLSRTNYSVNNWILLQNTLLNHREYSEINPMARAKLMSDLGELARAGEVDYQLFFDTIKYLVHEKSVAPWKIVSVELETIRIQLLQSEISNLYETYIRAFISPLFRKSENRTIMQYSETDYLENSVKSIIIKLACDFGIETCQSLCSVHFAEWAEDEETYETHQIPEIIRPTVYCHAIRRGGEYEWMFLWRWYNKDNPSIENDRILEALGCSDDDDVLMTYLVWSQNDQYVAPSDSFKVFRSLSTHLVGYERMKRFLILNIEIIYEFTQAQELSIDPYFNILFDNAKSQHDVEELVQLAYSHNDKLDDFEKIKKEHINKARRNVSWISINNNRLAEIFRN